MMNLCTGDKSTDKEICEGCGRETVIVKKYGICKACKGVAQRCGYLDSYPKEEWGTIIREYRNNKKAKKTETCRVCGKQIHTRGLCVGCYSLARKHGFLKDENYIEEIREYVDKVIKTKKRVEVCKVCDSKKVYAKGFCRSCYVIALRLGVQDKPEGDILVKRYLAGKPIRGDVKNKPKSKYVKTCKVCGNKANNGDLCGKCFAIGYCNGCLSKPNCIELIRERLQGGKKIG